MQAGARSRTRLLNRVRRSTVNVTHEQHAWMHGESASDAPVAPPSPHDVEPTASRKAPYVAPVLVRHGSVQQHTLGGGSFNP